MVPDLHEVPQPKPYIRSPLLLAAYCALVVAILFLVQGSGLYLIVGASCLAIMLALIELGVRLYRRRPSA
jgi:hypothetical protein